MQTYTGITSALTKRNLNLAIEWAHVGRPTTAHDGAIVVWRHHVGKIIRVTGNGRAIVLSGNDGHRVKERERSLRGAVAFREL